VVYRSMAFFAYCDMPIWCLFSYASVFKVI
jgi:hypothetical protein